MFGMYLGPISTYKFKRLSNSKIQRFQFANSLVKRNLEVQPKETFKNPNISSLS